MKRLLIVTALMAEAVPLVEFYRLKKQAKREFYHLFQNTSPGASVEIHLLVCGIGATKLRRGLEAYLQAVAPASKMLHLNFGIAGTLSEPLGSLLWANSIAGKSISLPVGIRNHSYSVHSLEEPSTDYRAGVLFDMEAEAWMLCIAENTQQYTPEALFCAKVVSDNRDENTHKIDKHWVKKITYKNIVELDYHIKKLIKSLE